MLPDELADRVRADGLLVPGRPVVVLLSGGRDSVCLLDLAVRVCGPRAVRALHCEYGLRQEATIDAEHCGALCRELGVELAVRHPRRAQTSGNLQAWARDERYRAAFGLADGAADVASGHTATDQAETVLYRLAASPGRRALLGMRPRTGPLVRPLLEVSRERTAAYCRARGLRWREDPSNHDLRFARARARNGLVPALRELHPAAEANLARTVAELRAEAEVLDDLVADAVGPGPGIELARLRALPDALARLVARRLAEDAAGRPAPDAAARLEEMLAVGDRRACGELHLAGGLRAVLAHQRLHFEAGRPLDPGVPGWRVA